MDWLSQCMDTSAIDFCQTGISYNKFLSYSTSLLHATNAINSAAMVESAMHVCFFEPQETAASPRLKIHPLVEARSSTYVTQLASVYPSKTEGSHYMLNFFNIKIIIILTKNIKTYERTKKWKVIKRQTSSKTIFHLCLFANKNKKIVVDTLGLAEKYQ